ncbi:MAG: FtsQ-type POTRA domain-containing protein [Actinomycetota bacterium]|nr:FtsQ-type POTRA domain-containing protein [Actinomycetota bacterium]
MNAIDHRIAERRQQVTEDRARGRLKWLIWLVLIVAAVGATLWLVNSPLLSIRSVTVTGAERTDPAAIANSLDAGPGTPTMSVDAGAVESALLDDPWIAQADVIVSWPGSVEIRVVEREPVVVVTIDGDGFNAASDGVLVERSVGGALPPLISTDLSNPTRVGGQINDAATLGAIEFVEALPPALRRSTEIMIIGGVVGAEVDGISILMGRPTEMVAKAAAIEALIAAGIEPGSRIDVTAPTRPAVAPPQSQVEGETEALEESQPSD